MLMASLLPPTTTMLGSSCIMPCVRVINRERGWRYRAGIGSNTDLLGTEIMWSDPVKKAFVESEWRWRHNLSIKIIKNDYYQKSFSGSKPHKWMDMQCS